jgi:hypothetical protein
MADLRKENGEETEVERLAQPAGMEGGILEGNKDRDEAFKMKGDVEKSEDKKEKLPKLSATDFAVYNSMSEHMEYFVGLFVLNYSFIEVLSALFKGVNH